MGIRCKIATAPIRRLAEQLNLNPIIATHYVSLWQESTNNTDSTLPQIEQLKGFIEKLDRKESYNKLNTPTFEKVKGNKGLSYNQNGVIMIEDYDDISNFYKEFSNRNDVIEYFDRLANNIEESQKFLAHLESLREQYAGEKSDNEIVTEALDLMKEVHSMTNPDKSSSRMQKIVVKSLGEVFTKIGDNFYDSQWNKVTDSSLINKLSEAKKSQMELAADILYNQRTSAINQQSNSPQDKLGLSESEYLEMLDELKLSEDKTSGFIYNFMTKVIGVNPHSKVDKNKNNFRFRLLQNGNIPFFERQESFERLVHKIFGLDNVYLNITQNKKDFAQDIDSLLNDWTSLLVEKINNPGISLDDKYVARRKILEDIKLLQRFLNRNADISEFDENEKNRIEKLIPVAPSNRHIGFKIQLLKNNVSNLDNEIKRLSYQRSAIILSAKNRLVAINTIDNLKDLIKKRLLAEYDSLTLSEEEFKNNTEPYKALYDAIQKAKDKKAAQPLFSAKEKQQIEIEELIDKITGEVPESANLLRMFQKANPKLKIIIGEEGKEGVIGISVGWFSPRENTLYLTKNADVYTALHEWAHAATYYGLIGQKDKSSHPFAEEISKFMDYIRDYIAKEKMGPNAFNGIYPDIYGFTNPSEFIAELFSNPAFQEVLANMPPMDSNGFKSLLHQIWDSIVNFLNNISGISTKDKTALDQAKKLGYAVMMLQQKHIETVYKILYEGQIRHNKEVSELFDIIDYIATHEKYYEKSENRNYELLSKYYGKYYIPKTYGNREQIKKFIQNYLTRNSLPSDLIIFNNDNNGNIYATLNKNVLNDVIERNETNVALNDLFNTSEEAQTVITVLNRLSSITGMKYKTITEREANNLLKNKVDLSNTNAFVYNDICYFIQGRKLNIDIAAEEMLHPFVASIKVNNPKAFDALLTDARKAFPKLRLEIAKAYPVDIKEEELVTQALSRAFRIDIQDNPEGHKLKNLIKNFINYVKAIFKSNFGENEYIETYFTNIDEILNRKTISAQDLNSNITISGLAQIINSDIEQIDSDVNIFRQNKEQDVLDYEIITTKQALEQANGFIGEVNRSPYIKVGNKFVLRKDTSTTKILGIITDRGHTPETWSYGEPYDGQTSYNVGYESGSNSVMSVTNRDLFDENWSPSSIMIKREDERLSKNLDTDTKIQISQFPEATFLVENKDLEVIKYLQKKGYSFKLFSDTGQDNNLPTQQQPSLTGQTKEKPKEQIVKLEDGSRAFVVKGDKIYENGREVFTSGSPSDIVNRNKVFANQAVKNGDAIVIGDDEFGKVVSYKDGTFFSVATGQKINATDRLKANAKIAWEKKLGTDTISNQNNRLTEETKGKTFEPVNSANDEERFATKEESEAVISSDKTILSNEELAYWNSQGVDSMPRILTASEHTDPSFHAKEVIDVINGKKTVPQWGVVNGRRTIVGNITGHDFAGLYIVTKHDGLPMLDILQTKIPKLIHFSVTTLGGTVYEPGVMKYNDLLDKIEDYIKQGLDPNCVTIRIDPIVPDVTKKEDIENVVKRASEMGIKRVKFSVMDAYANTVAAISKTGYDFEKYYGTNKTTGRTNFSAKKEYLDDIADFFVQMKNKYGVSVHTCAENLAKNGIEQDGCLSVSAVNQMLGTSIADKGMGNNQQRNLCSCYGGKVDALSYGKNCASHCIYCYAKHENDKALEYYNEDGTLKDNVFTRTRRPVETKEGTNQQQATGEAKVKPVIDTKGDTAQKIQPSTFTFSDGITVNTPFEVNDQQAAALDELDEFVKGDGIAITLSGYAGTGKTSIMQIFADKMRKSNKWIEFTASTNKAAAVLKSKVEPQGFTAKTLHKFFGIIVEVAGDEYDEENLTNVENFKVQEDITIGAIVVIDEASMINEENFKILTDVAKKKNLKLIFLGDEAQLAPVKEDQKSIVFRSNSISNKVITLTKVERTGDNAILAEATALRNSQPLSKVSSFNDEGQGVAYVKTGNVDKIGKVISHFIKGLKENSDFFRVLAYTNKAVAAYNQSIRRLLGYAGKEPQVNEPMMGYANWGYIYQTKTYQFINSESYKVVKTSEPHKIRYGQYELEATPIELEDSMGVVHTFNYIDIKNNQNNRIVATELARQKDILWKEAKKTFGSKKRALQQQISDIEQFLFVNDKILNPVNGKKLQSKVIDFGYAMTTHKSQGSTFTHVLVDENDISNAKNSTDELPPALKLAPEDVKKKWIAEHGGTVNTNPNDIKNLSQQLKYVAVSRATDTVTIISDNVISEGDPINPVSNSIKNEQAAEEIQDFSEDVSPNKDLTDELLTRITGANIDVIQESGEEFEKILNEIKDKVEYAKDSNEVVYGFHYNGKLYVNKDRINPGTLLHEYTHLWLAAIKTGNSELYESIKNIFRNDKYAQEFAKKVLSEDAYKDLANNEEALMSEVISRISSKKNRKKLEEWRKGNEGLFDNLLNKIGEFWKWIGKNLFDMKEVHSMEEVTDRILYDLLSKTDLQNKNITLYSGTNSDVSVVPAETDKEKTDINPVNIVQYPTIDTSNQSPMTKLSALLTPVQRRAREQWIAAMWESAVDDLVDERLTKINDEIQELEGKEKLTLEETQRLEDNRNIVEILEKNTVFEVSQVGSDERRKLINEIIGIDTIINNIKQQILDESKYGKTDYIRTQSKIVYDYFDLLFESAVPIIEQRELIKLDVKTVSFKNGKSVSGNANNEKKEKGDTQDTETGTDIGGNMSVKIRMIDPHLGASKITRALLSSLMKQHYEKKDDGSFEVRDDLDDMGKTSYINPDDAHYIILNAFQDVIISDDFAKKDKEGNYVFPLLENLKTKYPWVSSLIRDLKSNHQYISIFYSDMRMDFINNVEMKTDTTYALNEQTSYSSIMLDVYKHQDEKSGLVKNHIFSNDFKRDEGVDSLIQNIRSAMNDNEYWVIGENENENEKGIELKDIRFTEEWAKNNAQNVQTLLQTIGIDIAESDVKYFLANKTMEDIDTVVDMADKIIKSIGNEDKNGVIVTSDNVASRNTPRYRDIANALGECVPPNLQKSFIDGEGNTRYSFSVPSYVSKMTNLLNNPQKNKEIIENQYKRYKWFYKQPDKDKGIEGRWHWAFGYWIENGKKLNLSISEMLNIDGKPYKDWNSRDIRKATLIQYHEKANIEGQMPKHKFLLPIFADSPVAMFVEFGHLEIGKEYRRDEASSYTTSLGILCHVLEQEIDRILELKKRNKVINEKIGSRISNYDKKDEKDLEKFRFFPELNGTDFYSKAQDYKRGIQEDKISESEYENFLADTVRNLMETKIEREANLYEKEFSEDDDIMDWVLNKEGISQSFKEFIYAHSAINTQMIEMLQVDPAYTKDAIDFQKRWKAVYTSGKKPFTNSDYGRKTERTIFLSDRNMTSTSYQNIQNILNQAIKDGRIEEMDKDIILTKFRNINQADAQAYRCLPSFRAVLDMYGLWNDKDQQTYDRFDKKTFTVEDFNTIWQTIKPVVYSQISKPSPTKDDEIKDEIKVPHYHKNSEFLLLALYDFMSGGNMKSSNKLRAIQTFMEERFDKDGGGIDVVQFESAVKIGGQAPIDITFSPKKLAKIIGKNSDEITSKDYDEYKENLDKELHNGKITSDEYNSKIEDVDLDYDETLEMLRSSAYQEDGVTFNPNVVHEIDYEDYAMQQPPHESLVDEEVVFGSQLRNLIFADIPEDAIFIIDGKEYKRDELRRLYSNIIIENLLQDYKNVLDKFIDKYGDISYEKLSDFLISKAKDDNKLSPESIDAFKIITDSKGKKSFNLPLNNPQLVERIEQYIATAFKNGVTRQKIKGGACVLVSDFGLSDKLKIEYGVDENGNQFVKSIPCYMPANSKKYFEKFIDENDKLRIEDVPEELLEAVGYRIPTEDKYSMAPLKIVGFLPQQNGSCIMLPADIVTMAGSDFDIDKMFLMLPSFEEVDDELQYVKYDTESLPKEQSREARDNMLIKIVRSILTSPYSAHILMSSGNFDRVKVAGRISKIMSDDTLLGKYIENMNLSQQENESDDNYHKRLATHFEGALKNYSEDDIKKLNDFIKENEVERSVFDISTFIYNHRQNMTGGKLIGIYANGSNICAKYQYSNLRLKEDYQFTYNDKVIDSVSSSLDMENKRIIKSLAELLAASVDGVKDPVLADIMQMENTANIAVFMIRAGFTISDVAALFSNPIVRSYIIENESLGGFSGKVYKSYIDAFSEELYGNIPSKKDFLKKAIGTGLSTTSIIKTNIALKFGQNIARNFEELSVKGVNDESRKNNEEVFRTLAFVGYIADLADQFNEITMATRADSPKNSAEITFGGIRTQIQAITLINEKAKTDDWFFDGAIGAMPQNLLDKGNFTNISGLRQKLNNSNFKIPITQAFHTLGIEGAYQISNAILGLDNEKMSKLVDSFLIDMPNGNTSPDVMRIFYKDLTTFSLGESREFSAVPNSDKVNSENYEFNRFMYLYSLPHDLIIKKRKNVKVDVNGTKRMSDFLVLQNLKVRDGVISIRTPKGLGKNTRDAYMRDLDMLFMGGGYGAELVIDLVRYSYFHEGLNFGMSGLSQLFSPFIMSKFNEINNSLNKIKDITDDNEKSERFLDQFYFNNPELPRKTIFYKGERSIKEIMMNGYKPSKDNKQVINKNKSKKNGTYGIITEMYKYINLVTENGTIRMKYEGGKYVYHPAITDFDIVDGKIATKKYNPFLSVEELAKTSFTEEEREQVNKTLALYPSKYKDPLDSLDSNDNFNSDDPGVDIDSLDFQIISKDKASDGEDYSEIISKDKASGWNDYSEEEGQACLSKPLC